MVEQLRLRLHQEKSDYRKRNQILLKPRSSGVSVGIGRTKSRGRNSRDRPYHRCRLNHRGRNPCGLESCGKSRERRPIFDQVERQNTSVQQIVQVGCNRQKNEIYRQGKTIGCQIK